MKRLFALLPMIWLLIWIIAIATEIKANSLFLSKKTDNSVIVSTLLDTAYFGYVAALQK